ncbi:MAG: response regulator transcription factor [Alphaproteobacteria bacterium]|nr:response regulator transcription factor [Alphaproteobacteria bacterium]MCB9929275.1 response regulator transcription factor [Alphaproteobacteria bacterium]
MAGFLIVDDHPMIRAALETALLRAYPDRPVLHASDIASAEGILAREAALDLVLFDLNIPGADGFTGLIRLRNAFPRVPILVVTGHDDPPYRREARAAGAAGFVSKADDTATMLNAIAAVLAGDGHWPEDDAPPAAADEGIGSALASLTPQQLRVLELLGEGLLNKQIAHELDIVESTVKAHVSAILRKLNVHSRTQAVLLAQKLNFKQLG